MEQRQPVIDPATYEIIFEVYRLVAAADRDGGKIERNDISYIAGQLNTLLMMNSMAEVDPRADPKILEQIKAWARKFST